MKLKIGDRVRTKELGIFAFPIGTEFTYEGGTAFRAVSNGCRQWCSENNWDRLLEKIEDKKEQEMKLERYDTVYLKKARDGYKRGTQLEYVGGANFNVPGSGGKNLIIYAYERDECITKTEPTEKTAVAEKKPRALQVGDAVRAKGRVDGLDLTGKTGKVVAVEGGEIGVEFVEELPHGDGHGCGGAGKNGHCRWGKREEFELLASMKFPKHRRTFRLLKDTPEMKAGSLVQEACDNGDQEYVLLDGQKDALKFDDLEEYDISIALSRKTVEENPEWFEEVFKARKTVEKWLNKSDYITFKLED